MDFILKTVGSVRTTGVPAVDFRGELVEVPIRIENRGDHTEDRRDGGERKRLRGLTSPGKVE